MEQNNQDYYFELIGKYLTKEATEFEKNLLLEWVQSSEGNKKIFNDTKELWNLTSQEEPEIKFDAENAWLKIRPAMITANQNTGKPLERGKVVLMDRPWKPYLKIAAMLTLVCSVIFLISRFQKNNSNERLTFKTTGERKTIFLPDSSKIYLNKNTTFSYNSDFLSERKVYLQGEAFFEVRKSEGKTFVIETPKALTTVLGTSFNIKYNRKKEEEVIQVFTGKVSYASLADKRTVFLTKGMEAKVVKSSPVTVDTFNLNEGIVWNKSRLAFENDEVSKVFFMMENYFDVDIHAKDQHLLQCKFTGNFEKPVLEEMLKVLSLTMNITYTYEKGRYIISGNGCD